MKKELTPPAPLEEAIRTIEKAIDTLDEMINQMQKNQEIIKSWLVPGQPIGWKEENDAK